MLTYEYLNTFTVANLRRFCHQNYIYAPRSLRKSNLIRHILEQIHDDINQLNQSNFREQHYQEAQQNRRVSNRRRNRKQRKLIQIIRLFKDTDKETEIHILWETVNHKKIGVKLFKQILEIEKMKQIQLMIDRNDESKNNDECPICMCEFVNKVTTSCQHSFCFECLEKWKKVSNNSCPLCRINLNGKNHTENNLSLVLSYMDIINMILESKNRDDEESKLSIEILEKIKEVMTSLIENGDF